MLASKGLLLKGLLGFGAAVSVTYVGLNYSGLFTGKKEEPININIPDGGEVKTPGKLLDKVGLSCSLDTATTTAGVECTKKEGEEVKIKVKQEGKTFELSSLGDDGKIKVYKDEGYDNKFKFVIEEGDISEGENKLEEFETYEIKEEVEGSNPETKKHYLTRKTKASEKIKVLLGLDSCAFPEGDATTCPISNENIKKIKFDGKEEDATITGNGNLQITIAPSTSAYFPYGFKFTITSSTGEISIPRGTGNKTLTLTTSNQTHFMIKKSGSSLTLEETWTPEELAEKVGLSCTVSTGQSLKTGVECTKKGETNIKVKKGKTEFNVSSISSPAKIKLYKLTGEDADEYNKGLKFVIKEGSITVGDNKLEEFETYEIKEDGADWKLIRKNEAKEEIRKSLGIPCVLPKEGTVTVCDVKRVFKKIKFEGLKETEASVSGSPDLWIYKPKDNNDYGTFGYRFVLKSTEDAKFSNSLTIKKGTNTEFKIKKENGSLSLEKKAWTVTELGKKVGLNCPGGNSKECTLMESGIKVYNGENNKTEAGTKGTNGNKKITFETDIEGYSQGFKFSTTSDVEISKSSNPVKILANSNNSATYEIKEVNETWYLAKKST